MPHGARANLYVVVNAALMPEFAVVENSTLGVAERAYSTLLKTHVRGSLLATQAAARRSGIDLRLASIDEVIPYDAPNPFDTGYMRAVFDLGYRRAIQGRLWDVDPFGSVAPLPGAP